MILELVVLVPVLPLAGVLINGLFGHKIGHGAHKVAIATTGLSAALAFIIFVAVATGEKPLDWNLYTWVSAGPFQATVGFLVDPLSAVMMLVVTFVGFLIHVYSKGYMHEDPGYARFFTYMNLFMVSMLVLVLANNYFLMFLGWEGVGLCSYLLIGYWYEKRSASDAGKKAFVVNRIGDAGFLLGLFLIWRTFGSLQYSDVFGGIEKAKGVLQRPSVLGLTLVTVMCLLLFVGAIGKSAQLPLYVWLPDAMEGPTPVSALIHAATMVTAGVYMVARSAPLFNQAPTALLAVAVVGALTAVFAATIACVQNDIKRVVAYSTISQLGYMFLGCGVGAYASAIFHLGTHAFFKALLFLGAGSVIHALSGEQDIRKMGQLKGKLPTTHWTFLAASLANAGIFPLAGFWSKDEILASAFAEGHFVLWALGSAGAFLTAFYMFRLYFTVFWGRDNVDHHVAHHVHESPASMAVPLKVLGLGSILVGLFGLPTGLYHPLVKQVFSAAAKEAHHLSFWPDEVGLMALATVIAFAGFGLARAMYRTGDSPAPAHFAEQFRRLYRLVLHKYWVDEVYDAVFVTFGKKVCRALWKVDAGVVDGAVNGSGWLTVALSRVSAFFDFKFVDGLVNRIADIIQDGSQTLRKIQTGVVQNYLLAMSLAVLGATVIYVFAGWWLAGGQ